MYLLATVSSAVRAVHCLSQSRDALHEVNGLSGCWTLAPGHALTLRASEAGELCIARGRVWLTFEDAALDSQVRAGDHFLSDGESMQLAKGQTLVMESMAMGDDRPAYFNWEPDPPTAAVAQSD